MNNFSQVNSYQSGSFNDVASSSWYYNDVKEAFKLDLMKGSGSNRFSPQGNVTVAEAITIASRIHSTYNNQEIDMKSSSNN